MDEETSQEDINLDRYYSAAQAADVISRNSGRTIPPSYMHTLKDYGAIKAVKVGGRYYYEKRSVRVYKVEGRAVKANERWKRKAQARRSDEEMHHPSLFAGAIG